MVTSEQLLGNAWRNHIDTFAVHASRGRWKPYKWCVMLARFLEGQLKCGGARVIILAPPQHGKSELISHWLAAWFINWWPEKRIILTSFSDTRAVKWGILVRDEFLKNPESWVSLKKDSANEWVTTEGGGMRSAGIVGGGITGLGADLIINDDPHKNWEEALSPTIREKIKDSYKSVLMTRANPLTSVINIQTRWHEDDVSGWLMRESEENWVVIRLPALCEDEETDPLGRKEGEALCPESGRTAEWLASVRKTVGEPVFAGLYQQRPAPVGGGVIKLAGIMRYQTLPDKFDEVIQSWDLTFKKEGTSRVAGGVIGRKGANFYFVHVAAMRMSFTDSMKAVARMSNQFPDATTKLIENKANGEALVDLMQTQVPGLVLANPDGSKFERLSAVSGLFEAGNVWFPANDPGWLVDGGVEAVINEIVTFPNAAHDDCPDMASQGLRYLSSRANESANFEIPDCGVRENPWVID